MYVENIKCKRVVRVLFFEMCMPFFSNDLRVMILVPLQSSELGIPAGLKEKTTIELFSRNGRDYSNFEFRYEKSFKNCIDPPGAGLLHSTPSCSYRRCFIRKIFQNFGSDPIPIRRRSTNFSPKNLWSGSEILKKKSNTFIHISDTGTSLQLSGPRGMTSYTKKSSNHEIEKIMVHLLRCAESFFILCIFY